MQGLAARLGGAAMQERREARRLAAIMATDIVGYSRLIEADEKATLAAIRSLRSDVIDPAIAEHNGRIVKLMGDGAIVEFGSVVDAVSCAVAIQQGARALQRDKLPERRIAYRIGVNLGDVVVEGDDLMGDGVNIAARLEQICPSGGLLVSAAAYDQLQGKLDITFDDAGERQVKNITRPVHVYSARIDGKAHALPRASTRLGSSLRIGAIALLAVVVAGGGAWWFWPATTGDTKPSMIVLPFDNLSDDKEQGYLADGMSEDLTTELARVPGLVVLSRTAAFTYKDKKVRPDQIAEEMHVRYILEGSVRRSGDDLRINAQLVDATTGAHLWAERFDGAWSDVISLQNKVVESVALALELRLVRAVGDTSPGSTSNPEAYEAYLQGLELEFRGSPQDFAGAATHFKRAIALDPGYGKALAEIAWIYEQSAGDEAKEKALGTGHIETMHLAWDALQEALKYPSSTAYQLIARRHTDHWESEQAVTELNHAIALDPSDVWNYREMAMAQIFAGHPGEGLAFVAASLRVDPREEGWPTWLRGLAAFSLGHYPEAAALLEKDLARAENPDYGAYLPLMSAYGHLGATDKAASLLPRLLAYSEAYGDGGGMTVLLAAQNVPYVKLEDVMRFQDGLLKAGIAELPFDFDPKSPDRLSGDEMHKLMFGHTIAGRVLDPTTNAGTLQAKDFKSGVSWSLTTSADGLTYAYTWGDVADSGGHAHFEGNRDCFYFRDTKACAAIFRNPTGTHAEQNEYYWLHHWNLIAFSVAN
jgi:TolB-like protein